MALGGPLSGAARAAEPIERLLATAREQVRQGFTDAALTTIAKALKSAPDDPDAHILYQEAVAAAGALRAATSEYKAKAEAAPENALYAFLHARLLPADEALRAFTQQTRQFAESPWPHAGRAAILETQGKATGALEAHARAVALSPAGETRFLRGQAGGYESAGEWEQAVRAWNKVLSAKPGDLEATIGLGASHRGAGNPTEAQTVLTAGLAKHPRSVGLLHQLALVHFDAGKFGECLKRVEEALKLNARAAAVLSLGAEATLERARDAAIKARKPLELEYVEPAIKYAERAVKAEPNNPHAQIVLGTVHETLGDDFVEHLESALAAYDAALALLTQTDPARLQTLTSKAYVQASLGDHGDAVKTAEEALDLNAKHVPALLHAGHATVLKGNPRGAISKYYKKALKLAPKDAGAHHAIGIAHWAAGKQSDALKALDKAVELDPDDGRFRLSLGELHYENRRYEKAVNALFDATELRPTDAPTWSAYARAVTATEAFDEAAKAYEKTLELDPERNDDRLFLGVIYDRLDETEKAKAVITVYIEKGGKPDKNLQAWIDGLLEN